MVGILILDSFISQVIFQHLGYFLALDSQPFPICTLSQVLCSVCLFLAVSGEGSEVASKLDVTFRARCRGCSVWYPLGSPLLFAGCCILTACLEGFWRDISLPPFPCFIKCSMKFSERLICKCEQFPGKSSPWLLVSSYHYVEGLNEIYSLLSYDISLRAIFPRILWGA